MCGRYTSTSTAEQLAEIYQVEDVRTEALPSRWNVAPSLPVYAVVDRRRPSGEAPVSRQLGTFRWGLVPSWAKDPTVGNRMINARADSIQQRPAFRSAFARRRCIIPADAFYEWQAPQSSTTPGGPSAKRPKVPWAVRRRDGQPMAFAGLWEVWKDPGGQGELLRTCAIITTEANDLLAPIHHRMPVVLPASAWGQWLDPDNEDLAALEGLLRPAPDDWFEVFRVSSRVNTVTNEGSELLDPPPPPEALDPPPPPELLDPPPPPELLDPPPPPGGAGGGHEKRAEGAPSGSTGPVQATLFDVAGAGDQ